MKPITGILILFIFALNLGAQEKPAPKISVVFQGKKTGDTLTCKTPAYRQGAFCNFEDQLNRKKVPLNFQLGNSKY